MAIEISDLKQEEMHKLWPFIRSGLADIRRVFKPNWIEEDIYAAVRNTQVNAIYMHRGERLLGFVVFNKQYRLFSYQPEMFIWAAWILPVRDWLKEDDMPLMVPTTWNYLTNVAKTQYQTDQITWITRPGRAKAFARKWGWKPQWVTVSVQV